MTRRWGRKVIWIGVFLLAVWSVATAQDPPGRYVWPLDGYYDVSSGFCDYRGRHHHGGIDLSTGGREGIPVRAADSGWIERVSTSYWGYGKAVYLRMSDGRTAVYGHLFEFSDAIQDYVEENQYAMRRYQQNLWPAPGRIPVARGEIIAKTGQTGAGPPHLHFEIRTGDNRPLNPLTVGFEKTDRIAPTIHSVTIVPRQPDEPGLPLSSVDGRILPKTFQVTGQGKSHGLQGTPTIEGRAGIAIKTDDSIDGPRWTISTYRVRLWVNDVLITEFRHDSLNYDDNRQITVSRLFDGRPGFAERPLALYRAPGNRLWHYTTLLYDGWLEAGRTLTTGTNEIRIEASDIAGNTAALTFKLILTEPPPGPMATDVSDNLGLRVREAQPHANGLILTIENGGQTPAPALDPGFRRPLSALRTGEDRYAAWIPANTARDTIWLPGNPHPVPHALGARAVSSRNGGEVGSDDGMAIARFSGGDLFQSAFFTLTRRERPARAVSNLYELAPEASPFARAATFMIRHEGPGDPAKTGLYRRRGGDWVWIGNDRTDGGMIGGKIDWPGEFALLSDAEPPVIRNVVPGRGETIRNKRPWIRFETFDNLSGIGSDEDVMLTIDGVWVPVEYNPGTLEAKARPRAPLDPGEHRVEITMRDRVGNEATFLRILNIVR